MSENVNDVEVRASTNGNADDETIVISKKKYERLKQEREEYREIAISLRERIPRLHGISKNIDEILTEGGVSE